MPITSQRQRGMAEMILHEPEKARALGFKMPKKVASEFLKATPSLKNKDLPKRNAKT